MSYLIALFLLLIIASLAAAGFLMLRRSDSSRLAQEKSKPNRRMAHALALRVALSIGLFVCVLVSWRMGWIQPTGLVLR
jgi:cell division protein FtsW (lipid II flippase)